MRRYRWACWPHEQLRSRPLQGKFPGRRQLQQDKPTIEVLNALKLRASAVGNHEFDAGTDDLSGRVAEVATIEQEIAAGGAFAESATETSPLVDAISTGDVQAYAVLPFVNDLWTTTLNGAQFKEVLKQQWQPDGNSRAFLALGLSDNVSYSYNPARERDSRITSVTIDGAPIDPAR